jgi:hypothetical protein
MRPACTDSAQARRESHLAAINTSSELSARAGGAPGRVTPTVSDPRRNAVAFTVIDGNLRPFRARLISAIHASSVVPPRSRLGEVMAGGVRIYAPRLPLPDQIG